MDQQTNPAQAPQEEHHDAEVKPFPRRRKSGAGQESAEARKGGRKRVLLGAAALVALAAAGHFGYDYWTVGRFMVGTDDAYLKTDITAIAPRVQGYVRSISVQENQRVRKGDLLMTLDDGDYRNALKSAESRVATQARTIDRIGAQIEAAQAAVAQAEAAKMAADAGVTNATLHHDRVARLVKTSVATQAQVDDATAALDKARAARAQAVAQIAAARANVKVLSAQQGEAQSQMDSLKLAVDQARRNLGRTVLRAPVDGVVANLAVRAGDLVSPGQKIAAIVPVDSTYIEANYKETQLDGIAPGATAKVTIDALPGRSFTGRVVSVAPATGAQFSLLPAQNATGNFTKVVQRVPVRISLPESLRRTGVLRAGLSVVVDIDRRTVPAGH